MRFKFSLRLALSAFLLAGLSFVATAQVTTASISGSVADESGSGMTGAIVRATHVPSGSVYGVATRDDGSFNLPNLRVGGPYTVTASFTGMTDDSETGIMLALGQKLRLKFDLKSKATELAGVVITVDPIMNGERTGAATNISREVIATLPSISRSAGDYTRLTPMSDGNSFGGRNDQYNGFSLDGTIFNNPFGLDAATPGGQTDAQPVSLDAIDQIQVAIAPYDVTQAGFTGAAVNAVTKSGTNEVKGTVYGFFRNEGMTGGEVKGDSVFKADLGQYQTGFSVGGPIVKNKIFFFANAEIDRRTDLGSAWQADRGQEGNFVSRVTAADLDAVSSLLKTKYGYETGPYENYNLRTESSKALFKLDFNLSKNHKLTTTFNTLDAFKEKPAHPNAISRRGPDATTLQFKNSGYRINNRIYSGLAELRSTFGSMFSNKLQLGRTAFRDERDPFSDAFPVINLSKDGSNYIVAGHEPFSIHNVLDQDVIQFNDNFNIYLKKHTLTVGVAYEKFLFNNSFNLNAYGGTFGPGYGSVADFTALVNSGAFNADVAAARESSRRAESAWANPETDMGQISAYIQDEILIGDNFTLTVGIRADKPEYFDTKEKIQIQIDTLRNCCYFPFIEYYDETGAAVKFDQTVLPSEKILFSPRIGFNWDVKGDHSQQVRGGSGLFTGRFPFVWVGNQVANPNFYFYCMTDPEFKFPQVWRTNLGYDQKFGGGWLGSVDLIYTKDINAVMVRNYGVKPPSGTLQGADTRKIYTAADRTSFANNAYIVGNTDLGSSINATVEVKRSWKNGLYMSLGYNFGQSKDAASIDAEISSDAFDRNPAFGNVNEAVLSNSLYGNAHRVVGTASKRFSYMKGKMATTIGVFMQYVQGGRYSWTYSGDLNGDGSFINDLLHIPTDAQIDQMNFSGDAAAQRDALKVFIAQDDYLNSNRGGYAEKYANLSPWWSSWDVRILQDFSVRDGGTFQLSLDVLNAGNLLSSNWGVRQFPTNSQPIGVSVDATGTPTYSFDSSLKTTFSADPGLLSRWQMQVGLRYIF